MDDERRAPDENRKYDLADPGTVPEAFGSGVVIDHTFITSIAPRAIEQAVAHGMVR